MSKEAKKKEEEIEEITLDFEEGIDDSVVSEEHLHDSVKKLRQKLKDCEAEKRDHLTGWQKSQADFLNLRKRDEEERTQFVKFANERLIEGLIPTLESFDMAISNKEAWEKVDKNWRVGVEYIHSNLVKTLTESGLSEINPKEGDDFNPLLHEAGKTEETEDKKLDGKILQVLQKGYSLNGKVLKPAKISVGELKS